MLLLNFGMSAISGCPFITCQNFEESMLVCYLPKFTILASMFFCRDVCLSVCLSVLSSITHERFDISSPNLASVLSHWFLQITLAKN